MKNRTLLVASLALFGTLDAGSLMAASLDCKMHFDLSSWSVIYKHASGKGVVTCTDGQTMKVKIRANGGGLTVGKGKVKDAVANFSDITSISDVLGTYAQADASSGFGKAGDAEVLTKGHVSMAIAGAGQGLGIGVSVGALTIKKDE